MIFTFSFSALAADYRYYYVLQKDELVSNMLYRAGLKPIYDDDGTLVQISKINPRIKDMNDVKPGTQIFFSDEMVERSLGLGLIRLGPHDEVIIPNELGSTRLAGGKSDRYLASAAPTPKTVAAQQAEAKPTAPKTPVAEENKSIGLQVIAGLGMSYVLYEEKLSDVTSRYRDLRGPSFNFGLGLGLTDSDVIEADLKSMPIQFDNSSASLSNLSGQWQILTLQGRHILTDRNYSWLLGTQFHQMPLALFQNVGNVPTLKNIHLLNLSLGVRYDHALNSYTRTQLILRAQQPVSAQASGNGGSFDVSSAIAFDGSVGVEKNIRANSWLGLFWYGQYQQLKFSYLDPQVKATGVHSVFFSTIEARWTFDY